MLTKAFIQDAVAQYLLGYTTCVGPDQPPQNPRLLRGTREPNTGSCHEFYQEGWEDGSTGARGALTERRVLHVGMAGGMRQEGDFASAQRALLNEFRKTIGANTDPNIGIASLAGKVAERAQQIIDELEANGGAAGFRFRATLEAVKSEAQTAVKEAQGKQAEAEEAARAAGQRASELEAKAAAAEAKAARLEADAATAALKASGNA